MNEQQKLDCRVCAMTYGFGWLSAIYFINAKRRSIRWHALQSIVVFGGLMLGLIVVDAIFPVGQRSTYPIHVLLMGALTFISIGLWILLPLLTFMGKPFVVPVLAPLTLKIAGAPPWTLPFEPWESTDASGGGQQSGGAGQNWGGSSGGQSTPCGACGGSGKTVCSSCGGRGGAWNPSTSGGSDQYQSCGACIGSGRVTCMSCSGTGRAQALI